MKNKIKVLIFLSSLQGGGSQRLIVNILKYINYNKYSIGLVLFNNKGEFIKEIPSCVNIIGLDVKRARNGIIKINRLISKTEPDIVFSLQYYVNFLIIINKIILKRKNIKYLGRESTIASINNLRLKPSWFYNLLYRILYRYFDYIICQSKNMKYDLFKNYRLKNDKLIVINNPVEIKMDNVTASRKKNNNRNRKKILIAVGRLSIEKGFDLLLQAFSMLASSDYKLYILGEGNEKKNLMELSKELKIEKHVSFVGFQTNPQSYMKQADALVLSSRYEGFPNVVLEAMACGTQVVAFNCPGGTSEIITHGVDGWLVPNGDTTILAETIEYAVKNPLNEDVIKKSVFERYNAERIVGQYEALFKKVLEV